jgi:DNA-binding transcriptional regulator of glucitol operon
VRAEGFEPSRSSEHRHLKPACLPFHHARKPHERTAHVVDESVGGPSRDSTNSSGRKRDESPPTTSEYRLSVSTTGRRRPALIVLVLLAAAGCLALGWWQWTRFQSTSGSFQNLGYALQWPMFAGFCVYAYRKFVRYEEAPPEPPKDRAMTELPDGLLPERPKPAQQQAADPALREYNAYLAELAERDAERQNRTTA